MPALKLNFTKESEFEKSYLGAILSWTTSTAKHLIIIVNFLLIAAFISRFYFDKVLADLNDSVKIKSEILKQNADFEKTYNDIQKKIVAVQTLSKSATLLPRLKEIVSVIPPEVKLTSISYTGSSVTFEAAVPDKNVLNILINNLKSIKYVKEVVVPSVEKKSGNDPQINSFFTLKII